MAFHPRTSVTTCLCALALSLPGCGDNTGGSDSTAGSSGNAVTVSATGSMTQGTVDASATAATTNGPGGMTDGSSSGSGGTTTAGTTASTAGSTASMTGSETTWFPETTGDPTTGANTTGEPVDECKVNDDMDAVGACEDEAPADSFEPEVQWQWTGPPGDDQSVVTPLIANLTDDDDNGEIDLCDIPDVVVVGGTILGGSAHIYVLDGATGSQHFQIPTPVDVTVTPALGDIDGDGLPEIVTAQTGGTLIAFEHDGAMKWTSDVAWPQYYIAAIALADLDNDGDVEIIAGDRFYDHNGIQQQVFPSGAPLYSATTAADLDGDGDLEVVIGHAAYHHDGTPLYQANVVPGFPQVANLDDDPQPEVLITNTSGLTLLEHDGAVKYQDLRPTGDPAGGNNWNRPATIHDFDGDDVSEYASSSRDNYSVYEADASILWSASVADTSGIAAGTAFDFLGDGVAEAMYADEQFMFIFDGDGQVLLQNQRSSLTGTEYPVVVDVDNDGSAEIVVVSNIYNNMNSPTVQVIRDKEDRWIQARRIWNQHAYHVTNVREDGTIPQFEPPSWELLNTFRTNAQIESGGLCEPPIPE